MLIKIIIYFSGVACGMILMYAVMERKIKELETIIKMISVIEEIKKGVR